MANKAKSEPITLRKDVTIGGKTHKKGSSLGSIELADGVSLDRALGAIKNGTAAVGQPPVEDAKAGE